MKRLSQKPPIISVSPFFNLTIFLTNFPLERDNVVFSPFVPHNLYTIRGSEMLPFTSHRNCYVGIQKVILLMVVHTF